MIRILAVDDDDSVLAFLEMAFGLDGHEVRCATDGQAALEIAQDCDIDVVLMDVMMPGMDGLTATRRFRADPRLHDVPVIMLTACARDADMWEGWSAGAASYITKPVDMDVLVEELSRLGVLPDPTPRTDTGASAN